MSDEPPGYRVLFAAPARRAVSRLPESPAAAVVEFCFGPLAGNPRQVGKPLTRELTGYHSARRGQYRVVYRIDEVHATVYVVRIDHRRSVYRSW